MMRALKSHRLLMMAALLIMAAALAGCGDDDNPTNPGGGNGGGSDQFDESTAQALSPIARGQAVAVADRLDEIGQGVDTVKDGTWSWDAENQQWVLHYNWNNGGEQNDWTMTVQYRDSEGNPVQHRVDAYSSHLVMNGTGTYSGSGGGYSTTWSTSYNWDVTLSGLHTATYTATGGGSYTIDYTVTGPGMTISRNFTVDWDILDPGLTKPAGGCPTGTVRFTMAPYTMDVVFDGTDTYTWVLEDANGNVVDQGSGSLDCGNS